MLCGTRHGPPWPAVAHRGPPWPCRVCTHPLACSISNVPMFCWKVPSRTHTDEQKHSDFVLKICTRNWWEIIPDGAQMSNKSWFGGIYLGAMWGGSWSPGPEKPPRSIQDVQTTMFMAHPWGMFFGTTIIIQFVCIAFWVCLLLVVLCTENVIILL